MACDPKSGYIYATLIYRQLTGKSRAQFSVLQINRDLNHQIYHGSFYSSIKLCEHLLQRKTRVCSPMRTIRGTPQNLKTEAENMMKRQSFLHRNFGPSFERQAGSVHH
jgi:hypothetical protein